MESDAEFFADERVRWIRQRVCLSLDIPISTFDEYFAKSNEDYRLRRKDILSYFSSDYGAGSTIFFSNNKWTQDVEIEEEVDVDIEDDNQEGENPNEDAAETETSSSEHKLASPLSSPKVKTDVDEASLSGQNGEFESEQEAGNRKQTIIVKRTEFITKYSLIMAIDQLTAQMNEKTNVFFVRSIDGDIPRNLRGTDHFAFNAYFEFSTMSGEVLQGIADLVHQVYLPVIQTVSSNAVASKEESKSDMIPSNNNDEADQTTTATDDGETLRHELSLNVNKFEQQLRHVVQQTRGDTRIVIPNINLNNIEDITNNPHLIAELDLVLEEWSNVISSCIDQEVQLSSKMNRTPLGEIEYWRNRQLNVSSLYDQLNTPKVQQVINIMKTVENPQLASFNYQFGELSKLFLEARDNVKFLTTLERHFKHISEGTFQRVLESLPSMINGLRMVWVISRHYNTDERMAPLMEMISETFVRRIRDEIKLSNILSMDFVSAYRLVSEARDVLAQWNEQYFRMRKRIEETGSDHRWEFDRKALFGKTDYMSDVCGNILEIIDGLDRFKVFLGPELKAVTGDSAGIDEVLTRVENLAFSLKNSSEDKIFDKSYEKTWEQTMGKFRSTVLEIEKMTEQFIKESFRKLRSAEGAFELVKNFQKIGSSNNTNQMVPGARSSTSAAGSIKQLISDRYNDILEQYARELDSIKLLFEKYRDRPMLYKNFPPVAGAIAWARDLYHRAKRPIIRFKKHGGLLESAYGERVKAQYLEFARAVDAYINELFTDWETNVAVSAVDKLRNAVLRSIAQYQPPAQATGKGDKESHASTVFLPPPPYRTNFPHDLKMIIKEARYLDKLGFQIPEGALNVTLQEKKYQDCVRLLNSQLTDYDKILQSLKPVEKQLLKVQIDELNATIKTGFYPLNWTSQRIPAYIEDLNSALVRFSSIVSQVHKNSSMIEDILKKISSTLLVQLKDFRQADDTWHPLDITEFYDIMETNRNTRLQTLVEEYNSIGESFLLKLEEVVAKTATGYSPVLAGYYHYWEKCVYNALVQMIIKSMSAILGLLQSKDGPTLFRVNVSLNGKDLVVSPSLTDVDKFLTKSVRNIAESARQFVRWMHGTCLKTEPQILSEDEEPFVFSYYQDISQNPEIVKLTLALTSQTNRVYSIANKYLDGWRRYDKVMGLWNPKRKQQVEKLRPTCANLDSAMSNFQSIRETVEGQPVYKDIEFLHIDVNLVVVNVAKQAELWKLDYGEVLLASSGQILKKLQDRISLLESQISAETNDLDQLKFVLNVIAQIQDMMQEVELEMLDIAERYRTLLRYNIAVPIEELEAAVSIDKRWRQLFVDSRTRNLQLVETKQKFRDVTAQQDLEFRDELQVLRKQFLESGPGMSNIDLDQGTELLAEYKLRVSKLNQTKAELINAQNLFNLDVKPYPLLQQTQQELEQLDKIYNLYAQFKEFKDNMSSTLWSELDITALQKGTEDLEKVASKFPADLKKASTFALLESKLTNFKESLPLVVSLKNDAMKQRHWQKLMDVTGVSFDVTLKSLTLSNIFEMELYRYSSNIEEIINEAVQENKIENELLKIEAAWRNNSLSLVKYKKDGQDRGYVLRGSDDLKLELEDNMLNLQTISGSRYVTIFIERVRRWEKTLNIVSECLDMWYTVQRKWIYLEGIFIGAEDIRMQLPEEAKKFDSIDKVYKSIMVAVSKNPNVVDSCTSDNRLQVLTNLSERLDKCQKSLSDYLDTKRSSFPRFFFISDDELLSVLGSSDPTSIQVHLLKLFDNVKELSFARNNKIVDGMSSVEGESFQFKNAQTIEGPVETWMTSIEEEMHNSLKDITKEGVFIYASNPRTEWLKKVLGMVGLVGSQIWWTWEVEDTFRQVQHGNKYAMKELESKLTSQLNDLVAMVRDKLDSITRKKVNTLLIIDVHARDIVDGFVRESILHVKEFAWESQLRFYWDKAVDDCNIRQCTGQFRYGYEYMGLNGRLVITPLTDRCYMTLTQALTFKLFASCNGPAGTGKTETTKDLAKSLALPCFVINCGDGLDYKAMGSIFSGLVQVGAWGCFDEFNRINIEVLSVVSAQIRAIQNAMIYDKATCDIGMGRDILIKRVAGYATCGFFITMNPGYAGRTELPDNLKALFRPVTMIVPDLQQICEIMLFSEGFEGAKMLAKKMTVLYKLSKEQLSKQYHYDFGLRALKSVLVMAGGLKRQYQDMPEDLVLMRCLRDSNMPKFVFEDVPLFTGLISDLFPGMNCPRVGYEELKTAAIADLESKGYRCNDEKVFFDQVDKVIQMYETQLVRHTTMIVGPSGGGKSLILDTLKNARLSSENVVVKMFVLNPKAQPLNELYGEMDPVTRDWTDGILSKLFRELNERLPPGKENEMRWIVYDGDVDALWVENMNSVMDDNRLLTLPNGERIRLQSHCAMICETFDLQYASPATISRCGMVWIDPKNLGYRPYYERWIRTRFGNSIEIETTKRDNADYFLALFDKYLPACIDLVLSGLVDGEMGSKLQQVIPVSNIDMVKQLCSCLDCFVPIELTDSMDIEALYIYSVLWSVGGALVGDAKTKFDTFLKKVSRESLPESSLYECFYDIKSHRWEKWQSLVNPYVEPVPFKFYEVMVPTSDSMLYSTLLSQLATSRPILFVGESGTAKTTIIQNYVTNLPSSAYNKLNINFSSRTTSADLQTNIEANIDKRSGIMYGPPAGKKLIVFIDDLNMPKVDTYGTQQPIALLHYLMGRHALYDRTKDLNLKLIKDLQYIGAMGPPGGGRNPVDTRFIALFNVFNLSPPNMTVLNGIYNAIVTTRFKQFNDDVKAAASKITSCTLALYQFILEKMPPTPSKFHYIFNLRDLSRIYEGLCIANAEEVTTAQYFVRLWRHECDRVLFDRLTTSADHALYTSQMRSIVSDSFANIAEGVMANPCLFGDFDQALVNLQSEEASEAPSVYKDLVSYDRVREIYDGVLQYYNEKNKPMTLVLFEQALEHLCRIHRILRTPRGNALLVGVGGSGKQSLTQLATFCAGYQLFQITLSRGYNEEQFKEDLKELYKQLVSTPTVFLFTDAHVVEEGFLEFLNNMLTTGMVPALYNQEERDMLCNSVRPYVRQLGLSETPDNLWSYYVSRCRNNLHIVLSMSPSGTKLRIRCRNFPGFVSNCVIDWFFPWTENALEKVAEYFLASESALDNHRQQVIEHMVYTHVSVRQASTRYSEELRRYYYVTPKNYLDFISNYKSQLKQHGKRIDQSIVRLQGGLQKLQDAAKAVDEMSIVLTDKKAVVDSKTRDVQDLISVIQDKTGVASISQEKATLKQKLAEEQAAIIAVQKQKADEALVEALPAVEAASRALENLDRKDLTELKAFTNPPNAVKNLCYQLVCLRPTGEKLEENWNDAKKLLGNSDLLQLLKNYPKDDLTEKQIKKVNKYFNEDLTMEKMVNISKAGAGLLTWVIAIVKYYEVAKTVAPLRNKVKEMEKAQLQTESELSELQQTLSELSVELGDLNVQYKQANNELDILQSEAAIMTKRLNAASKLIDGLTGERTRWRGDVVKLEEQATTLIGDCLIGASFLSYQGAFTTDYRKDLIYNRFIPDLNTRNIPISSTFTIEGLLTSDAIVQGWIAKGLPADEHSIQNGILTTKASRFPLCIDPQQQAVSWIKRTYAGKNLTVKQLTDSDFMKHLELAIQFGNPFLFENVDEELDPMLDPILERNIVKQGNSQFIKLGDKMVEWDDNFRLFFTTKLANPHYSPEVMGKTMIVNYGVTMDGLANQLLNVVVGHERPDLEKQWYDLVSEMGENAQLLVSLEDTLLRELSNSSGNILDNQDLISTLENTKSKAVEIQGKLQMAEQTKIEISSARAVYKPVARRGSILYFAEAGLASINSMYEISLDSFLGVYRGALTSSKKDSNLENRLRNMMETIMRHIYDYTCIGIFERHKLMFSFQMTCMIMASEPGALEKPVLDFFLKGDTSLDACTAKCPASWLTTSCWKDLVYLQTLENEIFQEIYQHFNKNVSEWKQWYDLESPETVAFPGQFSEKLSPLGRLAVMRCFRPDRLYNTMKLFVIDILGEKFVQPPVLDYARIYSQSSPTMPMVFILSPGADPQADIQKFCDEMGMSAKFKFVALGQGQGPIAESMLDAGMKRGQWVLLQNCHLMASWLKTLEKLLNEMNEPHKDFRLWLTTEPTDRFPLGILQRSLKVVTEPPDGLKLNMRATYSKIDSSILEECPHWAFRPCLYVLAFLHAVVLERRKYGKIGWNVNYDFNESDFNISRKLLSLYLQKSYEDGDEFLPWGSLKYLVGDAMYGGRVSDDMDRRVLKTYLEEYMGDFLFDDCQKFSFSKVGYDYSLPPWGDVLNYTQMIEDLPLTNSPAVFGLHGNAEIGYYTNAVKSTLFDLISLQPRSAAAGVGMSREDYIAATASDISSKIPLTSMDIGTYDLLQVRSILGKRNNKLSGLPSNAEYIITPCQVVLLQELERWNSLIKKMAQSLIDLQRALKGEIGMSDDLDALGDALFNGFLPNLWHRLAPDTQKPLGSWMVHFLKRYDQYESWIKNGEPVVMWLSGLHIPESYLTALVQTTCRKREWPLDKSTLYTVVTKITDPSGLENLESGCYVNGLYLEGASWDLERAILKQQDPKVLVTELPIMQIIPIEASKLKLLNTFRTPVYVTQNRRNAMGVGLVFEADLATTDHPSHWVLQGAALSLNTDA